MKKPIIFMFSGQGSHYFHMGRKLYESNSTFKNQMLLADSIYRDLTQLSVLENLYNDQYKKSDVFKSTILTHPAIFMVEYALAKVIIEKGIIPDVVLGASLGEFVAAVLAGILSFEEAFKAVIAQAQMLESKCEPGAMMAIIHAHNYYEEFHLIKERSELAAINFATHFVISGKPDNLKQISRILKEEQIIFQDLAVNHGFHSSLIDGIAPSYLQYIEQFSVKNPLIPFVSCANRGSISAPKINHFWDISRKPIYFQKSIENIEKVNNYIYLDLGPSGTLATFVKYNLTEESSSQSYALLTPFGNELDNIARITSDFAA